MSLVAAELLDKLRALAHSGPIRSRHSGAPAVGMTLLEALGIDYVSTAKPMYKGIVVSARRDQTGTQSNRVNLFAKVPCWSKSNCKSSRDIVEKYGYVGEADERRLFCTVRAGRPNSQGLLLEVETWKNTLHERAYIGGRVEDVVQWSLSELEERLLASHPESMWVTAKTSCRDGHEYFHYRTVVHSAAPRVGMLAKLLKEGTVSVDHLIEQRGTAVKEKGPLFKISPANCSMLFPESGMHDLMSTF